MSDENEARVDAIVVGGGPAGLTAALIMAREGLEVALVERGEYAGSKNVGGLFYGTILNTIIPDAIDEAPIERPVSKRSIVYLGEAQHMAIDFGADAWSEPPYNNTYIVNRSQFDRWFAAQVEEAGVALLEGVVVEGLIFEGSDGEKKAVGVRLRGDEELYADAVILAEGANCIVTDLVRKELGLTGGKHSQEYAVGFKEIIALPRETIEDRFNLEANEGTAMDFVGLPFEGMVGGGFLYTAREAIHLGVAIKIETLVKSGLTPNEIMDRFKQHPVIRKYVRGGDLVEYSAHMLPEGGYEAVGELTGNGVLICGDAAGLLNMSLYKEGTNHAMESGRAAGLTVVEAKAAGDLTRTGLKDYEARLNDGIVMRDLKKYSEVPDVLSGTPGLLSLYPQKVNQLLVDYFTVSRRPKSEIQKEALHHFFEGMPKLQFLRDMLRARKMV